MALTTGWTGREACALQHVMGLSQERFAEHLGISTRTVASWHQKPTLRPKSETRSNLAPGGTWLPAGVFIQPIERRADVRIGGESLFDLGGCRVAGGLSLHLFEALREPFFD